MVKAAIHHLYKEGVGEKIGYVKMYDSSEGLVFEVDVAEIPPGEHGFHVHTKGDIEPKRKNGEMVAGGKAGEHYDPYKTGKHRGPYGSGHRGDLPFLIANERGIIQETVVAPHLQLEEIEGRALIIHSGGDNYSDSPTVNGGGKSRIAGGVITNSCPYCKPSYAKWGTAAMAAFLGYLAWRNQG